MVYVEIINQVPEPGLRALTSLRKLRIDNGHKAPVLEVMLMLPEGLEDLYVRCGYGPASQGLSEEVLAKTLMRMGELRSACLYGAVDWGTNSPRRVEQSAICQARAALPRLQHLDLDGILFPDPFVVLGEFQQRHP
eukprot:scaffold37119_cov45-Prasinocladus_malaysianus.AAC.1